MRKFIQYVTYQAPSLEELEEIINDAIKDSTKNNIIETPQGGICIGLDEYGKRIFCQATICEEEYEPKFDF